MAGASCGESKRMGEHTKRESVCKTERQTTACRSVVKWSGVGASAYSGNPETIVDQINIELLYNKKL